MEKQKIHLLRSLLFIGPWSFLCTSGFPVTHVTDFFFSVLFLKETALFVLWDQGQEREYLNIAMGTNDI